MRDSHYPVTIKTSPPSLEGVIERERLVDALAKLPAAAKWLQSPSGTGKSTLAACYARSCKKPLVWYRLDDRDNDPAFFYTEFADAICAQSRVAMPLPKFSSDDHARQADFAQRFARALGERLAQPTLIVLDDVQRVTNEAMQQALAALAAITLHENELLFVSESITPSAFFDEISERRLALLNDADLRFDVEECKVMTAALRVSESKADHLAELTGGHAGALVLACELLRETDPKSALGVETVERIYSHLLSKLVERMSSPRRELLTQTAFVTQLTRPIAETLAGPACVVELDGLAQSGLLLRVDRGGAELFEAHGLIRQAMQASARERLGTKQANALAERTAAVLTQHGQWEAAFALLVETNSTMPAIAVLEKLAERYAAHGHIDLLLSAIARLPVDAVRANAWLCFWAGQTLLRVNEEQAREWLVHSYVVFELAGNLEGMRLAAACVVTAFNLETGDLRELDSWIERHNRSGGETPVPTGGRFEASLLMGVISGAIIAGRYPSQIGAEELIARMRLLLDLQSSWLSDDQRVQAARLLIQHARIFGSYEQARSLIVGTRGLIDEGLGGTLHRARWLITAAYAHFEEGDLIGSAAFLTEARSLAAKCGSARLSFELGFAFTDHWMKAQDLDRASDELQRLQSIAVAAPPAQRAEYARLTARLRLLQGREAEGLRWAEQAIREALPAGFSGANLRTYQIELIYALAANNRLEEAAKLASQQDSDPAEVQIAIKNCLEFLLSEGRDEQALRSGLEAAAKIAFVNLLDRAREPLARICEAALANNIEDKFVRQVIALKQLKPPPLAGPQWPWPVVVRTLGGFSLYIRGTRYRPTHKAQDKPLELLKLLITCQAFGRDSGEKTWISERLWPDADGANARKSLDMTVGRLRRLLDCEDAIVATEGRLKLSPAHVWTDIDPLRRALAHAHGKRSEREAGKSINAEVAAANIAAVLEHYSGPFLPDDDESPWLLGGREAIAALVRQALIAADSILDGYADERLIPALAKAFALDTTSEDLARALLKAHLRRGQHGEAVGVYRRLREMMSLQLGIAPSAETDEILNAAYSMRTA